MSHPLIASKLYTQPWCILPDVHASICHQFRMATTGSTARVSIPRMDGGGEAENEVQITGPVALVQVCGVIGKHLSEMETECGGYDLAVLEEQMGQLSNDPSIQVVVIYFNTPGGMVVGVEAAANAIRACADSGKKIYGYTDCQCASAGYWLASACDEFHAEGSAVVGSISSFCAGIDSSRMFEMEGLELKLFRTGELKAIGMQGKAWTETEEKFMQDKVDSIDRRFKGFVSARRGLPAELMNGAYWYAADAPQKVVDSTDFPSLSAMLEAVFSSLH